MRRRILQSVICLCVAIGAVPASADIVWDQAPNQRGGYPSDTDYSFFGQPNQWQRMADDFQLDEAAGLTQVIFFGYFYDSIYAPENETTRIRFYLAREIDGLPNDQAMVHEQIVQNASRQETGEYVCGGYDGPEYRYSIDLSAPVAIEVGTRYWLEVAQLGDPESDFVWESAHITSQQDVIAGINPNHPNWAYAAPHQGLAFQLLTPEPTTIGMLVFGFLVCPQQRGRRGAGARSR